MKKLYLISPYHDDNLGVMELRYQHAITAAGQLIAKNYLVFSPIVHCHPIAKEFNLPRDRSFWDEYDDSFIEWADIGYVLCITGWDVSDGVAKDIAAFDALHKPVFHSDSHPL